MKYKKFNVRTTTEEFPSVEDGLNPTRVTFNAILDPGAAYLETIPVIMEKHQCDLTAARDLFFVSNEYAEPREAYINFLLALDAIKSRGPGDHPQSILKQEMRKAAGGEDEKRFTGKGTEELLDCPALGRIDTLKRVDTCLDIIRAMSNLPPSNKKRQIVLMWLEGEGVREIADLMHIKTRTVYKHLSEMPSEIAQLLDSYRPGYRANVCIYKPETPKKTATRLGKKANGGRKTIFFRDEVHKTTS